MLNGRNGREILRLEAKSGSVVELDACDSNDANEDAITYEWFVYGEAGTHRGEVSLASASGPRTQFTAPEVQQSETVHILLRLRDNGAYRRAVVTVWP